MEKENKTLKYYDEWKDLPIVEISKMKYSKDEEKRIWYKEWRFFYINIVNPMSNYLKSKLGKKLEAFDTEKLTSAQLSSVIHNLLPNDLTLEDKAKIIEENKTIKHK